MIALTTVSGDNAQTTTSPDSEGSGTDDEFRYAVQYNVILSPPDELEFKDVG